MSLDATIRAAVAQTAAAVSDLLVDVVHEPYASTNADGLKSYGTAVTRRAFVTGGAKALFRQTGTESVLGPTALFLGNVDIDVKDRITFPDGTMPPIIEIEGVTDPAGGRYYTQVKCGRPQRGAVT